MRGEARPRSSRSGAGVRPAKPRFCSIQPRMRSGRARLLAAPHHGGRGAKPLDRHQLGDRFRIDAGVAQRDVAAHRVGDDPDRAPGSADGSAGRRHRRRRSCRTRRRRPGAVAVAAQIRRDDVVVAAQLLRPPSPSCGNGRARRGSAAAAARSGCPNRHSAAAGAGRCSFARSVRRAVRSCAGFSRLPPSSARRSGEIEGADLVAAYGIAADAGS